MRGKIVATDLLSVSVCCDCTRRSSATVFMLDRYTAARNWYVSSCFCSSILLSNQF